MLLEHTEASLEEAPLTLVAQLAEGGLDAAQGARLMTYLEKVEVAEGEYLIRQGGEEGDLYLIERGKVSVYRECPDGSRLRLRTLGRGTAIGELGLYLKTGRTASAIADSPTTTYRLAPSDLVRMKDEEPILAAAFHEMIARMLAERLVSKDRSIEAMLR
jgi:SulP family sulfate permease